MDTLRQVSLKFEKDNFPEFEFRLGTVNNATGIFDSNIDEESFGRVLHRLKKFDGWEMVTKSTSNVFQSDRVRMEEDCESGMRTCVTKVKKEQMTMGAWTAPFAVRYCVSEEIPVAPPARFVRSFSKERESFVRKGVQIDMTVKRDLDVDSEFPTQRQIEVEIVDRSIFQDENLSTNAFHKILDVMRCTFPSHSYPDEAVVKGWYKDIKIIS